MRRDIPSAIATIAEMRAAGNSLTASAVKAGWSYGRLKRWIRNHPDAWYAELGRVRREIRDSACDEGIAILRQLLRGTESKAVLQAASVLARLAFRQRPRKVKMDTRRQQEVENAALANMMNHLDTLDRYESES